MAQWPLVAHKERENSDFKPLLSCGSIHLWKKFQQMISRKNQEWAPKGGFMLNSDLSPAAPQGGWVPPTDKTRVVSTRRRFLTNWVSDRTLQPSIESVIANSFVSSDFLVDAQVSGLGTVHLLLNFNFFGTWILPLHVPLSTFMRKSSSSVMDGLQRRRN